MGSAVRDQARLFVLIYRFTAASSRIQDLHGNIGLVFPHYHSGRRQLRAIGRPRGPGVILVQSQCLCLGSSPNTRSNLKKQSDCACAVVQRVRVSRIRLSKGTGAKMDVLEKPMDNIGFSDWTGRRRVYKIAGQPFLTKA